MDVVKRVDSMTRFFDVFGDGVGNQLVDEIAQVAHGNLSGHDFDHLRSNVHDLTIDQRMSYVTAST